MKARVVDASKALEGWRPTSVTTEIDVHTRKKKRETKEETHPVQDTMVPPTCAGGGKNLHMDT